MKNKNVELLTALTSLILMLVYYTTRDGIYLLLSISLDFIPYMVGYKKFSENKYQETTLKTHIIVLLYVIRFIFLKKINFNSFIYKCIYSFKNKPFYTTINRCVIKLIEDIY